MMKRLLLLWLIVLATALPAAARTLIEVAAVVNDEIITTYQLDQAVKEALQQKTDVEELSEEQLSQVRSTVLDQLVIDKLLEQRAGELGLKVTEKELDSAIEDVQRKNDLTREQLEQALEAQGMTMEGYQERVRREIRRYKLLGREVNTKVLVTSDEVKDYFREHIDEYRVAPRVHVARISYPLEPGISAELRAARRERLLEAGERLEAGEPFAEVLADQGPAVSGEEMGALVEEDLAETLRQALKDLAPGEVSDPVEFNGRLQIFQVTARDPGDPGLFDRVKGEIETKLRERKTDERFQQWQEELRANAYIDVRI